jgi:hypothetical protein
MSTQNLKFSGLFLIVLLAITTSANSQGLVKNSNDAGVTVTQPQLNTAPIGVCTITHTFDGGALPTPQGIISTSSGTQLGRLYRDGTPTTCTGDDSPVDIYNPATSYKYESYTFKAAANGCLTVNVNNIPVDSYELYMAVYSGAYNSANVTTNVVGQQGGSGDIPFVCPVVGGQTYTLVIMETYNLGAGVQYTISMDNVAGTAVPVSIWWIMGVFLVIGAFTLYKLRLGRS